MSLTQKDWVQDPTSRFRTEVPADTTRMVVVDLTNNAVYLGSGFPAACSTRVVSQAPALGQPADAVYIGGTDGYLYQGFVEGCASVGMPSRRVRFDCEANEDDTKLEIDVDEMEALFPTDGKTSPGAGIPGLAVLVCLAAGDGTFTEEWGVIDTNDNNTITLTESLSRAATTGDHFYVAPMYCGVLFAEHRMRRPGCLRALEMDVVDGQLEDQEMTAMVYCPETGDTKVSLDGVPDVTKTFNVSDLKPGRGSISMPAKSARALVYGLGFRPVGGGTFQIEDVRAVEFVHPSEIQR